MCVSVGVSICVCVCVWVLVLCEYVCRHYHVYVCLCVRIHIPHCGCCVSDIHEYGVLCHVYSGECLWAQSYHFIPERLWKMFV